MLIRAPMLSRPVRRLSSLLFGVLAATLILLGARAASAQKIGFTAGYPQTVNSTRIACPTNGQPDATNCGINRSDCLDPNVRWRFAFTLPPGLAFDELRMYARSDNASCADTIQRTGATQNCALVTAIPFSRVNSGQFVDLPPVAFVHAIDAVITPNAADRDNPTNLYDFPDGLNRNTICTAHTLSMEPVKFYLSLLLFSSGQPVDGLSSNPHESVAPMSYDIAGPTPPTMCPGAGSQLITLSWGGVGIVPNLQGFQAFCVPVGGVTTDAEPGDGVLPGPDTAVAPDTSTVDTGSDTAAADASDASGDGVVDTATGAADTTVATPEVGGSETSTPTGTTPQPTDCATGVSCTTSLPTFIDGLLPGSELDKYKCGGLVGSSSTTLKVDSFSNGTPLVNNQQYAVALTGVDTYGNTGTISNILCTTPKATVDFFDAYNDAGGTAGGGYCGFGGGGGDVAGAFLLAVGALGMAARRARRAGVR